MNDIHGHNVGDQSLIEVAKRLRLMVRDTDTVARLGGDEFVILLGELGVEQHKASTYVMCMTEKVKSTLSAEYLSG